MSVSETEMAEIIGDVRDRFSKSAGWVTDQCRVWPAKLGGFEWLTIETLTLVVERVCEQNPRFGPTIDLILIEVKQHKPKPPEYVCTLGHGCIDGMFPMILIQALESGRIETGYSVRCPCKRASERIPDYDATHRIVSRMPGFMELRDARTAPNVREMSDGAKAYLGAVRLVVVS